jgi:putative FmdB family regulatory protein
MALYDYRCPKCEDIVSVSHPMDKSPVVACESCSEVRVKVFSAPAVTFKGTGWGHQ